MNRAVRPKLDGSLREWAGEMRAKLLTLPRRPVWGKPATKDAENQQVGGKGVSETEMP